MRKFIISDLHGCGDIYESVMAFLENVSLVEGEPVHLYINGDLIDRGLDSFDMLMDVKKRCEEKGNVIIHYLAGNHEQLMYDACKYKLETGHFGFDVWDLNNSYMTKSGLSSLSEKELSEITNFIGNLDIYHKFSEKVDGNNVLLAHAAAPSVVLDWCDLRLFSKIDMVKKTLWSRKGEDGCKDLGKNGYLTIVGHTMNGGKYGFRYDPVERVLNIDGCCGRYATGSFEYRCVPLVEVKDGKLEILVFTHDNEIITGFVIDKNVKRMSIHDIKKRRALIEHSLDDKGINYRDRVTADKSNRLDDIDIKIFGSSEEDNQEDAEDDSDIKIYRKEDFTKK